MLTDIEIEEYYNSVLEHLIFKDDRVVDMSYRNTNINVLISAGRMLAISNYSASVKALAEFDKTNIFTYQLVTMDKRPNLYFQKNKCWRLRVTEDGKEWHDSPNIESIEKLRYFITINQKAALLDIIHRRLDMSRRRATRAAAGQNNIYFAKYLEAKEIIDKGITEDPTCQFPYTSGYAEVSGIDIVEAAKKIKFQYETTAAFLAESENLRIKYTKIVKAEQELENLLGILNQYETESRKYGDSL